MLLPTRCPLCDRPSRALCEACWSRLRPAPPGPIPALLAYDEAGRAVIGALKFRNARPLADALGRAMAGLVHDRCAVVTWAPTSPAHVQRRGVDQAELLARAVGRDLGRPVRRLLARVPGPPQTGRSRHDRLADPPRFVALGRVPPRLLVVDDVATTGATLRAAASALLRAGATSVATLAAAATPAGERRGDERPMNGEDGRPMLRAGQPKGTTWTSP